eukprot:CAMPEP_0179427744 /NCGR_PEP_ID=MMETSP0799-20121207/13600_1 /TAXON_ID=46947 /ORGANISM="Geminigera cryophila, Strain CCMP2564" /LENGTH=61 /DNA_ID=CAMNT_0021202913 /DNA_START=254 /DNA_END=439 /DNA_ORIENTATION=-
MVNFGSANVNTFSVKLSVNVNKFSVNMNKFSVNVINFCSLNVIKCQLALNFTLNVQGGEDP